jgi:hypothetical protein
VKLSTIAQWQQEMIALGGEAADLATKVDVILQYIAGVVAEMLADSPGEVADDEESIQDLATYIRIKIGKRRIELAMDEASRATLQ